MRLATPALAAVLLGTGLFALSHVAHQRLEAALAGQGVAATVERVSINPWRGTVTLEGVRLGAPAVPGFAWGEAVLRFDRVVLLGGRLRLVGIELGDAELAVRDNVHRQWALRFLEALARPRPDAPWEAALAGLEIRRVHLRELSARLGQRVEIVRATVTPDATGAAAESASFELTATVGAAAFKASGGWQRERSAWVVSGAAEVSGLALAPWRRLAVPRLRELAGRLDAAAEVSVRLDPAGAVVSLRAEGRAVAGGLHAAAGAGEAASQRLGWQGRLTWRRPSGSAEGGARWQGRLQGAALRVTLPFAQAAPPVRLRLAEFTWEAHGETGAVARMGGVLSGERLVAARGVEGGAALEVADFRADAVFAADLRAGGPVRVAGSLEAPVVRWTAPRGGDRRRSVELQGVALAGVQGTAGGAWRVARLAAAGGHGDPFGLAGKPADGAPEAWVVTGITLAGLTWSAPRGLAVRSLAVAAVRQSGSRPAAWSARDLELEGLTWRATEPLRARRAGVRSLQRGGPGFDLRLEQVAGAGLRSAPPFRSVALERLAVAAVRYSVQASDLTLATLAASGFRAGAVAGLEARELSVAKLRFGGAGAPTWNAVGLRARDTTAGTGGALSARTLDARRIEGGGEGSDWQATGLAAEQLTGDLAGGIEMAALAMRGFDYADEAHKLALAGLKARRVTATWPDRLAAAALSARSLEHARVLEGAPWIASEVEAVGLRAGAAGELAVARLSATSLVRREATAGVWIASRIAVRGLSREAGGMLHAEAVSLASLRHGEPPRGSWRAIRIEASALAGTGGERLLESVRVASMGSADGQALGWRLTAVEIRGLRQRLSSGRSLLAARSARAGKMVLSNPLTDSRLVAGGVALAEVAEAGAGSVRAATLRLDAIDVRVAGGPARLAVRATEVSRLDYRVDTGLRLGGVRIRGLQAAASRDAGGRWRWPAPPLAGSGDAPGAPLRIEHLALSGDNALEFADHGVEPTVRIRVERLAGELRGFSSAERDAEARFSLRATVRPAATLELSGRIAAAGYGYRLAAGGVVRGLELAPLTGYSRRHLGVDLQSGRLDAVFTLSLAAAHLAAEGRLVFRDAAARAAANGRPGRRRDAAARQLLSALREGRGERTLEVLLSGDIDDPRLEIRVRSDDGRLSHSRAH